MFRQHDGALCPKKRDYLKLYGESFHGSFKRSKQGNQTQEKLEKNITLFYQRLESESDTVVKPDVQLHQDAKVYICINQDIYARICTKNMN